MTTTLALGKTFSCALRAGRVNCWGDLIGDFSNDYTSSPYEVPFRAAVTHLATGDEHACAILADESVWCWGNGSDGQITGEESSTSPIEVEGLAALGMEAPRAIGAAYDWSCVLDVVGKAACWGSDTSGQLGGDCTASYCVEPGLASQLSGQRLVEIGGGFWHTCARTDTRDIYCWGGNGALRGGSAPEGGGATRVLTASRALQLAVGREFACIRNEKTEVSCWGSNESLQLGHATSLSSSPVATTLPSLPSATDIAAGAQHACMVGEDGDVWCWGNDAHGQSSGRPGENETVAPEWIIDVDGAVSVAAGYAHTCVVLRTGEVACWGSDDCGQLGQGRTEGNCSFGAGVSSEDVDGSPALVTGLFE